MIQVDIGGHPPIPFEPPLLVLSVEKLVGQPTHRKLWGLMIQVDIGGHPPIPFGPTPSVLSVFQFQHNLLFLAVFWVKNF